jgi:hypothetical protein
MSGSAAFLGATVCTARCVVDQQSVVTVEDKEKSFASSVVVLAGN